MHTTFTPDVRATSFSNHNILFASVNYNLKILLLCWTSYNSTFPVHSTLKSLAFTATNSPQLPKPLTALNIFQKVSRLIRIISEKSPWRGREKELEHRIPDRGRRISQSLSPFADKLFIKLNDPFQYPAAVIARKPTIKRKLFFGPLSPRRSAERLN